MRPTIAELLAGAAKILGDQVLPAVQDPFAASQIATVVTLLEDLATEWGDAIASLVEENATLEALLAAIGRTLARSPDPSDRVLAERLVAAAEDSLRSELRFEPLDERRRHLRDLLTELVEVIHGADPPPGHAEIRTLLIDHWFA